jgi:hypothetical protein
MQDPERPPAVPESAAIPDRGTAPGPGAAGAGLRRRLVVLGICVVVALATVVAVQRSVDGSGDRRANPGQAAAGLASGVPQKTSTRTETAGSTEGSSGGNQVPAQPAAALGDLLSARAAAIRGGDRAGWLAALAPASDDAKLKRFRSAQAEVFDRIRQLRPVAWSYQVAGGYPLPVRRVAALGGAAWLADVELDYQLAAGAPTVQRQQFLTVVRHGQSWALADDTDGATGRDVWDLGPISQASSARCLVIGARGRQAQVRRFAAECAVSARTVDQAWGSSWPRRTVLTVPNTLSQLAVLLGRSGDTAGLEKTAAVTVGPSAGAADTVLINASAFDELSPVGRRVVLTHEMVHVATRATGSRSAPTWLSEGYADYVAYADTGLSAAEVAGEALTAVRDGKPPTELPAAADFNAAGDQAAAAYGFAWVAAGLIAAKVGDSPARMRAFYQQAAAPGSGSAGLDAALAAVGLGGTKEFVGIWQARLRRLAE